MINIINDNLPIKYSNDFHSKAINYETNLISAMQLNLKENYLNTKKI